jgi:hypothetical protein
MKGFVGRLLGRSEPVASEKNRLAVTIPQLVLREGTTLPIVQWDALDVHAPQSDDPKAHDEFWTAVASAWLERLKQSLGTGYNKFESERFLLLGSLDGRPAKVMLDYVEKTRRRILLLLEGIAHDTENGKTCILVLRDKDTYYRYVSNYFPEEGEFAQSGGMFLQFGYGHFVFTEADMHQMEPTIAHELTHCLVQHLPLPAWLNEGIAVNTEHRLSPPLGRPLETPAELHQMHQEFWNATTIQEFWSGKSWNRAGDGNKLSYDLATHFVQLAAADREAFGTFVNSANLADSGASAAASALGYPVEHLAHAVLGEGEWAPKPQTWNDGIEHGQF